MSHIHYQQVAVGIKIHTTQHSKYNQHNKTDIVVLNMIERKFLIIDVACPFQILVKDRDREY